MQGVVILIIASFFGCNADSIKSAVQAHFEFPENTAHEVIGCYPPDDCANDDYRPDKPTNCKEILDSGETVSKKYIIYPKGSNISVEVYCDMDTRGGGWTVIQRRFNGAVDFYRDWREYRIGFGTIPGERWIGLENIYHLTAHETNQLLVELTDKDGVKAYALYDAFAIGSEVDGYRLNTLQGYSGDAGDSLSHHVGQKFTTKDLDLDSFDFGNCAELYLGAWWYNDCFKYGSNLNGKFRNMQLLPTEEYPYRNWQGIIWSTFKRNGYFLSETRMLVRPQ
uniref:Microfibril-associated glycoprotein 4-like n=1 Tax=Diabrotica virgifera virgifera TaxID=50390 RepID=A0A6P7GS36_DIAVI